MASPVTGTAAEFFPARVDLIAPAGMLGPESRTFDVSAFVVRRAGRFVLVDTLMQPGHIEVIDAALERAGAGFADLEEVVLTHHHPDHTGGLAEVARRVAPGTRIRCGAGDVGAVSASTGVEVQALTGGELVLGMEVIATPGHTPGHLCLFDAESSTMLLGDLVGNYDGWQYPPPAFTHDADQASTSLQSVVLREFSAGLPSHGAPVNDGAVASLREFLDRS